MLQSLPRQIRFSIAALWVLIFCSLAPFAGAQAAASGMPMPPERVADSYAIYSLLMPGDTFSAMPDEQNQRWAIADTTVSIKDMNPAVPPQGQLKPPPDNAKAFQLALRDYEARKNQRVQLMQNFHVDHPYDMFNSAQINEFKNARTSINADSDEQEKYDGYPGVTYFSQVFFNSNQTAALVYMNNWCANFCNAGQWFYLEKHGGKWVRRSGVYAKMS